MGKLFLVGFGGFFGAALRYLVSGVVQRIGNGSFPYGTFAVNLLGCLAIGFLAGLSEARGVFAGQTRAFLFIGVLGGFTTFSTYSFETFALLRDSQFLYAAYNVFFQTFLGLAGVWAGYVLSRLI